MLLLFEVIIMPAAKKVSKDEIIDAAIEVLRDDGFAAINARSVAKKNGLLHAADLFFLQEYGGIESRPDRSCYPNAHAACAGFAAYP